jgi:hypothetical protein
MTEYQDLLKDTSQSYDNGDYFIVTIPGLIPGTIYPLEFRYKYKDGTFGEDWSAVKVITAPSESVPLPPSPAIVSYSQGIITVKWDGKNSTGGNYPATLDKIEVYIKWAADADNLYVSKGSIPATGGELSIPVLPGEYNIKLRSVSKTGMWSGFNQVINVTAKADAPGLPTVIVPAWSGTDFTIGFNSDPSAPANSYLSFYLIKLTATDNTSADFTLRPTVGTSQKFSLSLSANRATFGVPQTSFSGSVSTVDIYGNVGSPVTFGAHVYVNNLPAPVLAVTEMVEGYTVSYPTPADTTFSLIEIQEVESTSATAPASGYNTCFTGSSNPAVVTRSNQNKRWVRARFIANNGSAGQFGTAVEVTPKSVVVADLIPPTNPTGIGAVAAVDPYDQTGFSLSSKISWTASVDTSTRGYRLRWSPDNPATVTNPNWEYGFTNATSFTASGLIPNVTYYYQVAAVDQYNNTQTYSATLTFTAVDAAASAVSAAARLKSILAIGGATGDLFKFGTGIPDSINTSLTTTAVNTPAPIGGYHGILLNKTGNKNNYWLTTGQLRVGTDSQFMYFNGTNLYLTGNINAASGSFTGHINMASGGSLYSGSISGSSLSGAGYMLNSSGLTFNSASVNGITTINGTTGKLTTASATIGDWDVTTGSISKTSSFGTLTLNSALAQIVLSSTSYTAGIATPNLNSPSDIVFWAGGSRSTAANFYVQANGTVVMKSATITGVATSTDLTTGLATKASTSDLTTGLATKASTSDLSTGLATKLGAGGAAADVNSNTTNINGGKIRTGSIQSQTYLAPGGTSGIYSQNGMSIVLDTTGSIISKQFVIDASGNAYFKGALQAASGTFSGALSGATLTATDGVNTLTIGSTGAISNSSTNFSVTSAGVLTAKSAIISGNLTATTGSIGGWLIGTSSISSGGTTLSSNGKLALGVTGDDALTMNAGSNISMFATSGTDGASNIYWYRSGNSGSSWDTLLTQTAGGNFLIRGRTGSSGVTSVSNLIAYTYLYNGAEARSYNNTVDQTTFTVSRQLASAAAVAAESSASGRQRIVSFGRRDDGGNYSGAGIITIDVTGSSPQFEANSDIRIKKNFEIYDGAQFIEDIKNISPYKFHYKDMPDTSEKRLGFIANDFYENYKDVISGNPDAVDEDGDVIPMTFSREALIPHMFAAIKYLVQKVEELENR